MPRASWKVVRVCVTVGGLCMAAGAWAVWPGYYLVSVYEKEGLATVDFKYWGVKKPNSAPVHWPEVGFGYGVTKRWYTELYASYVGSAGVPFALSDINWQNDYLLTQGQYPFDLALHTNLKWFNNPADGHFLEWGPALQTELGARTQLNANVFFERTFNAQVNPSASKATQLKYQWQVKHRWLREFQFGAQGFGELGDWDHWAERSKQSHRYGPAVFGVVPLSGKQAVKWETALLFGETYTRPAKMLTARVQLEF